MWLQYRFFRVVAGLEVDRLYASDNIFRRHWELVDTKRHAGNLVRAGLWRMAKDKSGDKGALQSR